MAAFYPPFSIDSVFSSNDPIKNPGFSDEFYPDFNQFYSSSGHNPLNHQENSSLNTISNDQNSCLEQQSNSNTSTEPFVTEKQRSRERSFTSMEEKAESGEQVTQILGHFDKKRKSNHGSPSISANSKEVKQVKCKKQKGSKEGMKDDKKAEDQASEEPPKGYIHVRARRGQATDSHSLAERARREKISQKMKTLQALVPGCDKVTGKALMLDEIINYVQSLQNQVELLSMKLASLDPMVYIFGLMDHDTMAFGTEVMNNGTTILPMSSIQSTSHSNTGSYNPPLAFTTANTITNSTTTITTTTTTTAFAGSPAGSSVNLLQHEQKPNIPIQDARSSQWGLDDLQQDSIINQFALRGTNNNNLYSFH